MSASDSLGSPLDMLAAWHRLGEEAFETLRRLVRRQPMAVVDLAAREAAWAVTVYFDKSIAVHHADEERDLFPELIDAMAGSDPVCLREMMAGLVDEHRALAATWRRLRPAFAALAAGTPQALDAGEVDGLIAQCERLFRREDEELLPMADRLLDDAARARIFAKMDTRHRG